MKKIAPKRLAKRIVKLIWQKKADDIVLLNMKKISSIADYFVICSVSSSVQGRVAADVVIDELKKKGLPFRVEGYQSSQWILIDCFNIVLHIFQPDARVFYALEKFWGDAPREEYPDG